MAASAPGSEGFTIDLFDNSLYDAASISRPSSLSTIRIEHDSAGMLAINLPPNSCRSLHFGFVGVHSVDGPKESSKIKASSLIEHHRGNTKKESASDDECVKKTHSLLREIHQAIFDEQVDLSFAQPSHNVMPFHLFLFLFSSGLQVFDMVNREAFNQSLGVNVTGIRENYLQLSIGQGMSLFISLVPSSKGDDNVDSVHTKDLESAIVPLDSSIDGKLGEREHDTPKRKLDFPNRMSCEIYLEQVVHEHAFSKGKDKPNSTGTQASGPLKDGSSLLAHFCMSLAHRIFSNRVLMELENVVLP